MQKTWKYFISIPLCAHARVFHLDRARCDLNSRSDHAPSFLSILMPPNIYGKLHFFISPLLSFFYFSSSFFAHFFPLTISIYMCIVSSNDDSYIDGKRWVDTFEQLIGRRDLFFALCLEQLFLPLIVSPSLILAWLTTQSLTAMTVVTYVLIKRQANLLLSKIVDENKKFSII